MFLKNLLICFLIFINDLIFNFIKLEEFNCDLRELEKLKITMNYFVRKSVPNKTFYFFFKENEFALTVRAPTIRIVDETKDYFFFIYRTKRVKYKETSIRPITGKINYIGYLYKYEDDKRHKIAKKLNLDETIYELHIVFDKTGSAYRIANISVELATSSKNPKYKEDFSYLNKYVSYLDKDTHLDVIRLPKNEFCIKIYPNERTSLDHSKLEYFYELNEKGPKRRQFEIDYKVKFFNFLLVYVDKLDQMIYGLTTKIDPDFNIRFEFRNINFQDYSDPFQKAGINFTFSLEQFFGCHVKFTHKSELKGIYYNGDY